MSRLSEEIKNRYAKRRKNKIYTWANFIVRLFLLIFVIIIIRFFSSPETEKFRNFIFKSNSIESNVENNKSE